MPQDKEHIMPLYKQDRVLFGVVISPELWSQVEDSLWPILERGIKDLEARGGKISAPEMVEPLHDWEQLKSYWDFRYPYTAEVHCDVCGNATEDWEKDSPRLFRLRACNMGGMAIFVCQKCHARVIKRHFKDKITCECKASNDAVCE
ncbi:MAG: hypothetical protein AB7E47_05460 [Desulfovibrionaceae bacterium]